LKRRGSALIRVLVWTALLLAAVGLGAVITAYYAQYEYAKPGPLVAEKVFIVEQGLSASEIGDALARNGIVESGRLFAIMAQVTGQRSRLKAGEYAFPAAASMRDVMALIASGKAVTYKISIPEGFTSEMVAGRVNTNEVLTGPPVAVPPEGSILPDTYVFRRGMTRQKLIADMQSAQQDLLAELWAKRKAVPVIQTKEQAVTLASIVEKETAEPDERPLIAAVFINRLEKGMRLQSDPTIIYGMVGGKGRLDRPLSKADIARQTPYNTYRINGLPPGPIANPGRAALEAVLNPEDTPHLYFVADGTGGHAFASTLEEHNRNVSAWRKLASAAASAAADDPEPGVEAPGASSQIGPDAADQPLADVIPEPESAPSPVLPPKASTTDLQPGTIVMVEGRPAPIPRLRPLR
jgi:UPF0755 protein